MAHTESFSRGFDRGNYGNAYESQDWESWVEDQKTPEGLDETEYHAGMLLGFFSCYELHEIGDEELADKIGYYRKQYDVD